MGAACCEACATSPGAVAEAIVRRSKILSQYEKNARLRLAKASN
jgi:hypothetical protein